MKNLFDDLPPITPREQLVKMAYAIIDMNEELYELRNAKREAEEWRAKYLGALDDSINHSQAMIGNILQAAVDPDSGLNRMHRALARDPLQGAQDLT